MHVPGACTHSNQGLGPDMGWLQHTHSVTERNPCFHVTMNKGWSRHGESGGHKFPNCLCSISTRQLELLLWRAGLTAQHMQDSPIFFIQLNCVNKSENKVLPPYAISLPQGGTCWEFYFLLISEAMHGKHWEEVVGLLGLLSRAIVPTV